MTDFIDPGVGDPEAPVGTEGWAQRWRLALQHHADGTETKTKRIMETIANGLQHRAWTLITDKHGKHFDDFRQFVSHHKPWGLGKDPDKFLAMLELEMGKEAAQLETVAEPQQGRRTDLEEKGKSEESTSPARRGKSAPGHTKDEKLRAINRAPSVVGDLYRQGLINQTEAAKLGKKGSDSQKIEQTLKSTVKKVKSLPKKEQRQKVNEVARELAGTKTKTRVEKVFDTFLRFTSDEIREFDTLRQNHFGGAA